MAAYLENRDLAEQESRTERFMADGVPCYAWSANDRQPWFPRPTVLARMARRAVPAG